MNILSVVGIVIAVVVFGLASIYIDRLTKNNGFTAILMAMFVFVIYDNSRLHTDAYAAALSAFVISLLIFGSSKVNNER